MADDRHDVEAIFDAARRRGTAAERAAYLDGACGADAALRTQVEALLWAEAQAGNFLESPPSTLMVGAPLERPGAVIGRYKLLQRIGEGGFGVVFMAEQQEPVRRKVALKIIKLGMDTRQVITRFEAERQALAMMDHPNIARVLDGGATESGRPFFVMELVKGVPITDYCDTQQLSTRERLELFIPVCLAVQHAHQKGVIHRDLKPGNVLVTMADCKPMPKVIDFGIAKATEARLTEKTLFTEFPQLIGTPAYMSPEQAEMTGIDIDTRSDVYSLGVLLYELLTGTTPFDKKRLASAAYAEIQRIIREEEPPKPSTRLSSLLTAGIKGSRDQGMKGPKAAAAPSRPGPVPSRPQSLDHSPPGFVATDIARRRHTDPQSLARALRGDLDWIVMKALEKDRTRRFDTSTDLARDIERHLKLEPVLAGPPSTAYRVRKFVRRHRGAVGVGAGVVAMVVISLAIIAGLYVAERDARVAEATQRRRAEVEAERASAAETHANEQRIEADRQRDEADRERDAAEYQAYRSNITDADLAIYRGERDRAHEMLQSCPERLRNWEWGYLESLRDNSLVVLRGHSGFVLSAAFSRDGKRVITASWDQTARVWDADAGKATTILRGHEDGLFAASFNSDGTRIVTASADRTARVWDGRAGVQLLLLSGHDGIVYSAAFSPDSSRVVTASEDSSVRVWDAASGKQLLILGHEGSVGEAAFSPDGSQIITGAEDGTFRVWNSEDGQEVGVLRGHDGHAYSAEFNPDGSRVVTASGDGTTRLWDLAKRTELGVFRSEARTSVYCGAFCANDTRIIVATSDPTKADIDWRGISRRYTHGGVVHGVVISTHVVESAEHESQDGAAGHGTNLPETTVLRGHARVIRCVAFSPDRSRAVTASEDGTARLWDVRSTRQPVVLRCRPSFWCQEPDFGADGFRVLLGGEDGTGRVWDLQANVDRLLLRGHESSVYCTALSLDGTRAVTASADETARVWDARTGEQLVVLRGHRGAVFSAAFSPDGTLVVTRSSDHTARVWSASTGAELAILKGQEQEIVDAAFSPDAKQIVTGSDDGTARVWDAASGEERIVLRGHGGRVASSRFNRDGTRVVTASWDGTGRLWDATNGKEVAVLRGHVAAPGSAAFSPDGTRVVTSSLDGTVRVWSVDDGWQMTVLRGHTELVTGAVFSPDGTQIATYSHDGTYRIWDSVPYRKRAEELQTRGSGK